MSSPYDGGGQVPAPDQSGQTGYQPPPPFAPPPTGPVYPPAAHGPPPGYGQYHPQYQPQYQWPPPPQSVGTNGMAIASMVLGILWLWWVGSILALIFGYLARSQIKQRPGQGGDGMAIAGIVLGWVGVAALIIVIIFAVAITDSTTYSLLTGV